MFRRVWSGMVLAALLSSGTLGVGRALAASSAPVATATPVAYQPVIGNALSYEPGAGTVRWTATSEAPAPGLTLQGLAASLPWAAPASAIAATPTVAEQAAVPASRAGAQVSVAATPRATAAANPAATPVTGQSATTTAHHTGATSHTAPGAQVLRLPGYVPISVPAPSSLDGGGLLGLGAKFLVVLALLFVCLRVLRAVMPRMQGAAGRGALVLFSESIGDKQRICLLDLQVKLALVSISSGGITPITTIDDAEQIAALRAQYQPRQSTRHQGFERVRPGLRRGRDRAGLGRERIGLSRERLGLPVDRAGLPVDRAGLTLKGHGREAAPEGADGHAQVAASRREPAPSFASMLQQEAGGTSSVPWPSAPAVAATQVPQGSAGAATGGDMSFAQALATIRSLRQKVEQQ